MQIFIEIRPLGRKLCHFENFGIFPFRKCSKASASTNAEFLHALTYHIDLKNILSLVQYLNGCLKKKNDKVVKHVKQHLYLK